MAIYDREITLEDYKNPQGKKAYDEDANVVYTSNNANKFKANQYPKNIRERISTIKNFSYGSNLIDKSRYTSRGMIIGTMFGLGYAMMKKKNLLAGAFFGGVIGIFSGYMVGEYIVKPDNENKDE